MEESIRLASLLIGGRYEVTVHLFLLHYLESGTENMSEERKTTANPLKEV